MRLNNYLTFMIKLKQMSKAKYKFVLTERKTVSYFAHFYSEVSDKGREGIISITTTDYVLRIDSHVFSMNK